MNLSSIKLIRWDLDETFWTGTLSEVDVIKKRKKIKGNNIRNNDYSGNANTNSANDYCFISIFCVCHISWSNRNRKNNIKSDSRFRI